MYVIIWEYQVKPERQAEFEKVYGPEGTWTDLFKKGIGYLGTELLQHENLPQRYLTVDRWASRMEYDTFLSEWDMEYKALDAHCAGLTESELLLGKWIS